MRIANYGLWLALLIVSGCAELSKLEFDPTKNVTAKADKIIGSQPSKPPTNENATPEKPKSTPPQPDVLRFTGTGEFIKHVPKTTDTTTSEVTQPGDITLNFEGTDIREVVKVVLSDLLGINYLIDPGVQGSVTMSTGKPLTRDMLLPTLETMLRMNKAALVYRNGTYYVMPAATAIQGEVVPQLGEDSQPLPSGYSIRIVPLRYIGVAEMDKILKPLTPEGSILRLDPVRNLMILAGSSSVLANLLETIETFDVNWIKGLSIGIFRIKNAELETVMKQIETLTAEQENNPLSGMFKVVPIESANSILIVTHQPEYLEQIGGWIERLDKIGVAEEDAPILFVYRVKNGEATELADMLSQLFAEGQTKPGASARVAPGMNAATLNSKGGNKTPRTKTAKNTSADSGVTTGGTEGAKGSSGFQSESGISVVADDTNNSLLIRATPTQYKEIESALAKLDILPLQVLVEATIVEVTLKGELQYGLQWYLQGHKDHFTMGGGWATSATQKPTFPGFNWAITKNDVGTILNALAGDGLVKVLSSPSVMVLDNHTANIKIGTQVAITTTSNTTINSDGTTNNSDLTNNNTYKETGVMLDVTPRVTPGGLVIMEVNQEVSAPDANSDPKKNPNISTRTIDSTVAVQDGQVVVLGGLIQDIQDTSQSGIPGLYKAPVLGWLFGQTTKTANRKELVVILSPKVLRNDEDIGRITAEFKSKLHGLKDGF